MRIRNISLAAGTAIRHLSDDPILLVLQISRLVPDSLLSPTVRLVAKGLSGSSAPAALLATHVAGDIRGLERKLVTALAHGAQGNSARLVAEICLAAGRPDWADKFLSLASECKRYPATLARRRWYDGDMSGAVQALTGQRGTMKRQRSRLVGEMRLLSGQGPELVPVAMVPVPGRVLHFLTNSLPHTTSGYAQRSHSILTAQQDLGAEILAVTRLGYPVQVGKIFAAGEDVVSGITYRRMIPSRLAKTADERVQQEAAELLQIALEFRPEILHTTTHFTNGLVVGAVAEALGIPWVYEVRGQLIDTWASSRTSAAKSSERYKAFQSSETSVMRKANSVATLGRFMKDGILAQGVPDCKIIMVPNAVGGDFLQKPETHTVARTKLGLDAGCDYIGTVSSLVDYEGMDDLIEAFALLAPRFPNLRLLIVGSGPVAPALKERVRHLNLSNIVIFTGRVPREQARVYHQALDIFVVPRKDLPVTRAVTPLKPVEALSCARPVVASDLPALREIVEDGVNGKLYGPDNIGSLAETLSCLLLDKNEMERLGLKGRDMVLETRTWASNASVYARNYDELKDR